MIENQFAYPVFQSAGLFQAEHDWIHPRRCIDSYEIIFVLDGEVAIAEETEHFSLKAGDVLLLEPGKLHYGTKSCCNAAFYWIHFTAQELPVWKCFSPADDHEVTSQIRRLLHIANTPGYPASSLDAAVLLLINELHFQFTNACKDRGNTLAARIYEHIRIHAAESLTVRSVAEQFGYTSGYISKLFRKYFRIGLKDHIETTRIKYAKNLLLTTSLSIKEISAQMGYGDENCFIKFFTYQEGISPSRYRNQYFNTHLNNR